MLRKQFAWNVKVYFQGNLNKQYILKCVIYWNIYSMLLLSTLGKNYSRQQFEILFFPEKRNDKICFGEKEEIYQFVVCWICPESGKCYYHHHAKDNVNKSQSVGGHCTLQAQMYYRSVEQSLYKQQILIFQAHDLLRMPFGWNVKLYFQRKRK